VSVERVCVLHAVSLLRQHSLPAMAPVGTPIRTGGVPRACEGGCMRRIHPAVVELLLLLALAAWLWLASGLG
jgi:hypothetical protein